MADTLQGDDLALFRALKKAQVFQHLDGNRLDAEGGSTVITCGDNYHDRFYDVFAYHGKVQGTRDNGRIEIVHSWAAGAIALALNSPVNKRTPMFDLYCVTKLRELVESGKFKAIALYAHFPCLGAQLYDVSFQRAVQLLIDAKSRLKREVSPNVACFCHFDLPEEGLRTYFLSRPHWEEWIVRSA